MGKWKPPGRKWNGKRYNDELDGLHWSEFERVMGRWYTSQGYEVEERGTQSARQPTDGGVDLVLRRGDEKILVQCKHERCYQVPYTVAMQLRGLIHADKADRAILVITGEFTPEALKKAAQAGRLELIDGEVVRRMLGSDLAGLRDGVWVKPATVAPAEAARLPALPRVAHIVSAPDPVRRVTSRPISSKLTVFALLAFAVVLTGIAGIGVRQWDTSPPSQPVAIAPPGIEPVPAAPAPQPKPKPRRHPAVTAKPKAKTSERAPVIEAASAPPEVIYKSADMSDTEFEAWKLRKARRDGLSAQNQTEPPMARTEQESPTGPATPAQTMQVILRTNRH